jgi:hypothetical protein
VKNYSYLILAVILYLLCFGFLGEDNRKIEAVSLEEYCEMINLYSKAKENGVKEANRPGWPPYKGVEQCQN